MKKTMRTSLAVSLIAASVALAGCASKQETGQLIGVIGGGALCHQLTRGQGNVVQGVATLACAGLGGYVGDMIGKSLDDRDRAALATATQNALNSKSPGTRTWTSETSGATAQIKVGSSFTEKESVKVSRSTAIEPVASMQKLNAQYLTLKASNVRNAPKTDGIKLATLPAMTEFTAMGKTGDWILVGRQGTVVGYVYHSLVKSKAQFETELAKAEEARKPAPVAVPAEKPVVSATKPMVAAKTTVSEKPIVLASNTTPEAKTEPRFSMGGMLDQVSGSLGGQSTRSPEKAAEKPIEKAVVSVQPAFKLDDMTPEKQPELVKIVQPAAKVETTVQAETTCKSMSATITDSKGKASNESVKACKSVATDMWASA